MEGLHLAHPTPPMTDCRAMGHACPGEGPAWSVAPGMGVFSMCVVGVWGVCVCVLHIPVSVGERGFYLFFPGTHSWLRAERSGQGREGGALLGVLAVLVPPFPHPCTAGHTGNPSSQDPSRVHS